MFPLPAFLLTQQGRTKAFKIAAMILFVVAFIGLGAFCTYVWLDRAKAKSDLLLATQAKAKAEAQLVDVTARANRTMLDLAKLGGENADRVKAAKQREREIRNVPKDQDGAVAPVLLDSLERLR